MSQFVAVGLALLFVPLMISFLTHADDCSVKGLDCLFAKDRPQSQYVFYWIALPAIIGMVTSAVGAPMLLLRRRSGVLLTAIGLCFWFYVAFLGWTESISPIIGGLLLLGTVAMMAELGVGWLVRGSYEAAPH